MSKRHSRSMNTLSGRDRPSGPDAGGGQRASEGGAGELATLFGIEDLRPAKRAKASSSGESADTQNDVSIVFDRRQASTARLAQSMIATRYKAPANRHIGDIGRPHLIWPVDHHMAQEIREDLVSRRRLCGSGLGPSAAMPILRINRCTRLRWMRHPSPLSTAVIRREPGTASP
nr:hypothetical protein [Bradyrhizobium pachyrhizi]